MARKPAEHERGGSSRGCDEGDDHDHDDAARFGRRSYLGLAGVALGAGLGGASVPATATDGGTTGSTTDGDDAGDAPLPNTLTIRGTGTPVSYEFTVDGALDENPNVGAPEGWESIAETTATGQVTAADAADGYRFAGSVVDVTIAGGDSRLVLNGEEVTPDEAVAATALPRTITVRGTGTPASYEFTVDGAVQAAPESGDLTQWDNVDGRTVTGWVTESSHVDSYRFAGEVTGFTVEGDAEVDIDGGI